MRASVAPVTGGSAVLTLGLGTLVLEVTFLATVEALLGYDFLVGAVEKCTS